MPANILQDVTRTEALVFAFAAVVAVAVGASSTGTMDSGTQESELLTWENEITVKHNGEVVAQFHNVLTDQGKDFIRDKISAVNTTGHFVAGDANKNATFIAVGNGSAPVEGDTQLAKEVTTGGLSRAQGSAKTHGAGNFSVKHQFTANADIGVVNTTSLNWNSTGPSIVSGGAFGTEANIVDGDSLTVTHNITIS